MSNVEDLRVAIATEGQAVGQLVADVNALLAKLVGDGVYAEEVAAIQAQIQTIRTADSTVVNATPQVPSEG